MPEIGKHCFAATMSSFDHALDSIAWPFDPQHRGDAPVVLPSASRPQASLGIQHFQSGGGVLLASLIASAKPVC